MLIYIAAVLINCIHGEYAWEVKLTDLRFLRRDQSPAFIFFGCLAIDLNCELKWCSIELEDGLLIAVLAHRGRRWLFSHINLLQLIAYEVMQDRQ